MRVQEWGLNAVSASRLSTQVFIRHVPTGGVSIDWGPPQALSVQDVGHRPASRTALVSSAALVQRHTSIDHRVQAPSAARGSRNCSNSVSRYKWRTCSGHSFCRSHMHDVSANSMATDTYQVSMTVLQAHTYARAYPPPVALTKMIARNSNVPYTQRSNHAYFKQELTPAGNWRRDALPRKVQN